MNGFRQRQSEGRPRVSSETRHKSNLWRVTAVAALGVVALGVSAMVWTPFSAREAQEGVTPDMGTLEIGQHKRAPSALAGSVAARDPVTGQLRAPTAQEYAAMVQRAVANQALGFGRPTQPPVADVRPDGTVGLRLDGRFGSFSVARVLADGSVQTGCVTNEKEAEAFFNAAPVSGKEGNDVK